MKGFLLHLQSPMQSWADTGFGQIREAGLFPSRAAVLGIVAAALGIPRADDRLVALHDTFRVHVATARDGETRKDYHTVETDPSRNKTLTWRDYHHDAHFVALVLPDAGAEEKWVERAMAALRQPTYTAFLGRRACPPAVPLRPELAEGRVLDALAHGVANAALRRLGYRLTVPESSLRGWELRQVQKQTPETATCFLDGHFEPDSATLAGALEKPTYGTRRDRLVAPKRAYVNRPFTRISIQIPAPFAATDHHQTYFDAAS